MSDVTQQFVTPVAVEKPVEGVDTIGAIPLQVRRTTTYHFIGAEPIAVTKGSQAGVKRNSQSGGLNTVLPL